MHLHEQSSWRAWFVRTIWATHNDSAPIQQALGECLKILDEGARGLNIGSGGSQLHPRMVNLDLVPQMNVHVCSRAEALPFRDQTFDLVLSQELLEHVRDPFAATREMRRVMKRDGTLYCQVPFTIGYHPGPTDFWRFSREGLQVMLEQAGLECSEVRVAVGPGTGFYRILVEFFATCGSAVANALYLPAKAAFSLLFYPLKWLDPILVRSSQVDRIAGGYLVIAKRKNAVSEAREEMISTESARR